MPGKTTEKLQTTQDTLMDNMRQDDETLMVKGQTKRTWWTILLLKDNIRGQQNMIRQQGR